MSGITVPFIAMGSAIKQTRMTRAALEAAIADGRLTARLDGAGRGMVRWLIRRDSLAQFLAARP